MERVAYDGRDTGARASNGQSFDDDLRNLAKSGIQGPLLLASRV
jgi:hypothetical protein